MLAPTRDRTRGRDVSVARHRRRRVMLFSTLLTAVAMAGCAPEGSLGSAVPVDPDVHVVPSSIVSDCSVDVTAALQEWIASVPDGGTLAFGRNACYNIDGGLVITDRHDLTFEGNGSTFRVFTKSHRDRANWTFQSGSNLTLRNMIARGANPYAGLADSAYDTNVEGQHAFRFEATQGALLESVEAYDLWGDFVEAEPDWRYPFPGEPARDIVVRDSRFERNGRMGIGLTHVDGFVMENSYVGDVRWSAIDLELDDSRAIGRNIRIEGNRFGLAAHQIFVSKGSGTSESIGNIVFRGNVMEQHLPTCLNAITMSPPTTDRYWTGWIIADNVLRVRNRAVAIVLTRAKDAQISNNTIISGDAGGCAAEAGMSFVDSHDGSVMGNTLVGGYPMTHTVDALTTGFVFASNVIQ